MDKLERVQDAQNNLVDAELTKYYILGRLRLPLLIYDTLNKGSDIEDNYAHAVGSYYNGTVAQLGPILSLAAVFK